MVSAPVTGCGPTRPDRCRHLARTDRSEAAARLENNQGPKDFNSKQEAALLSVLKDRVSAPGGFDER